MRSGLRGVRILPTRVDIDSLQGHRVRGEIGFRLYIVAGFILFIQAHAHTVKLEEDTYTFRPINMVPPEHGKQHKKRIKRPLRMAKGKKNVGTMGCCIQTELEVRPENCSPTAARGAKGRGNPWTFPGAAASR